MGDSLPKKLISDFSRGEISPLWNGRSDAPFYHQGASIVENLICLPTGGVTRRPGTRYVAALKDVTGQAAADWLQRLVPFRYNQTTAYVLELGHEYMRFFKGSTHSQVLMETLEIDSAPAPGDYAVDATITGGTSGTTAVIHSKTDSTHYVIKQRDGTFTDGEVISDGTNSLDCAAGYPIVADDTGVLELALPYQGREIFEVQVRRVGYDLYITHPTYNPRIVTWGGTLDGDWTIAEIAPDAQAHDTMKYYRKGDLVKYSGSYYVCAAISKAGDWNIDTVPGGAEWTAITPTAGKLDPFTGAGEYPAAVAHHQGRMVFAGFNNTPNRVMAEMVEHRDVLFPGPNPADPWDHQIAGESDQIVWAASAKHLILGTMGEEIIALGGQAGLTPDTVHFDSHTAYGSEKRQAILVGSDVVFIQRGGLKIRALQFMDKLGGYEAPDLTLLSDHITLSGIVDLAYQQTPDSIVWGVRSDGVLVGATYNKEFGTVGWQRHPTDATHLSVAVIPTATEDELWLATERTINSTTVRYIEYMESRKYATRPDAYYVDCGLTATGSGITSVNGLDHLQGETVDVVTDGKQHAQKTVSPGGSISLDVPADKVHVGKNIPCVLRTMRMEMTSRLGTTRGQQLRVVNFIGHFVDTVGCQVGPDADNLDTMHFTTFGMGMGQVIPLYSGTKSQTFPGEYDQDGYLYIKQAIPQPFTLVGIVAEVEAA